MLNGLRRDFGLESLPIPKCYYASKDEKVIVLEDLKGQGFSMKRGIPIAQPISFKHLVKVGWTEITWWQIQLRLKNPLTDPYLESKMVPKLVKTTIKKNKKQWSLQVLKIKKAFPKFALNWGERCTRTCTIPKKILSKSRTKIGIVIKLD